MTWHRPSSGRNAIGSAGAKNAAYFAAQILGLKYEAVADAYAYAAYRRGLQGDNR